MAEDIIIHSLKQRWFAIALAENYPHTPTVTAELDRLEEAIRSFKPRPSPLTPAS